MTQHDLGSLGVGQTLTTREFSIRPVDLTARVESDILDQAVGACSTCTPVGNLATNSPAAIPWGRVCPSPVAIDRALAALTHHVAFSPRSVTVRSVERIRSLGAWIVGEPVTATAQLRFVSRRNPECTHLTVGVEVHRRQDNRQTTILSFEAGLELHAAAGPAAA